MNKILTASALALAFFSLPATALDHVIITEVLYDPINTDTGGEAVQIFNPTDHAVDISGWVIATETSAADATVPQNSLLQPNSYYLIADSGWSANKDNPDWPEASHEEALTLANTNAGVALVGNGTIIDAVGWGNKLSIAEGLFEGSPAAGTEEGKSLQRAKSAEGYVDSGNNSADFVSGIPKFSSAGIGSLTLTVEAVVTGAFPIIESAFLEDEDETVEGTQVTPLPKKNKTVHVEAQISDLNGLEDIAEVTAAINSSVYAMVKKAELSTGTATFYANISLPYYFQSGNHTITISAKDSAGLTSNTSITFEYLSLIAVELDTSFVSLSAAPGAATELIGDTDMGTADKPTLLNIGNTKINIEIAGTGLASGQNAIPASSLMYNFGYGYKSLSADKKTEQLNLVPGTFSAVPLSLKLQLPLATQPGNYVSRVSLSAVAS